MNLFDLSALIQDEKKCEEYLRQVGILKTFTECPKCKSTKIGRIRRNKHRCYSCKYEWHIRKGSVLEGMILEYSKFIACIKLFELEVTPTICSKELEIAYETAAAVFQIIRSSIAKIIDKNNNLFEKQFFADLHNPVLVIIERNNKIIVSLYVDYARKEKEAGFVFVKRSKNDQNQISYLYEFKHTLLNREANLQQFNTIDRFWRYSKVKLSYFKIDKIIDLYLYLKEQEIRFNIRDHILFEEILKNLVKKL